MKSTTPTAPPIKTGKKEPEWIAVVVALGFGLFTAAMLLTALLT